MSFASAIVLFAVIWFMVFLMMLPQRLKTQGEAGDVVPGTHASAPSNPEIKRKVLITTAITAVLWALVAYIIISGTITVRDMDWLGLLD